MSKKVIIAVSLLVCAVMVFSFIITGATALQYFTCPNDFQLSASSEYLMSGGYEITVTAQLYKNGQPHMLSGIQVYFEVPRGPYYAAQIIDGQGSPPTYKYVDTDDNGQASITLKSEGLADDYEIEVKAYVMISKGEPCYIGQFRTLDVTILAWGRIEGTIRDFLQYPVPGAILSIYPDAEYNQNTQSWGA